MPITTYCQSKWKLQYPANDANVFAYWGDAFNSNIRDCFVQENEDKPVSQACCPYLEIIQNNGDKDTYGTYSDIKIIDKQGICLNC